MNKYFVKVCEVKFPFKQSTLSVVQDTKKSRQKAGLNCFRVLYQWSCGIGGHALIFRDRVHQKEGCTGLQQKHRRQAREKRGEGVYEKSSLMPVKA